MYALAETGKYLGGIMKFKSIVFVAVSSLLLVGCSATPKKDETKEKDLKKITFVLDWTPNTNHTGLYVAKEKGYYQEMGLDVEIVQPSDDSASMIVANGKADFGITAQDSMAPNFATKKPLPITAVATILQHNTSGIMSRKGEGMNQPKGMEGKVYATWDSPVEQAMIKDVMKEDGADFDKVKLVPNTIVDEAMALKQKQVDSLWVFYGWGGIMSEIEKVPVDMFYFKDLNPKFDYYTPVIISNEKFLKDNEKAAKDFLAATAKGYEDAIENPDQASEILIEQVPEINADLVKKSQKWMAAQYKADEKRWGYINPERWNAFYQWLGDEKLVEQAIPKDTGFTNQYLGE